MKIFWILIWTCFTKNGHTVTQSIETFSRYDDAVAAVADDAPEGRVCRYEIYETTGTKLLK